MGADSPRLGTRRITLCVLVSLGLAWASAGRAAEPVLFEVRRTFASPECDTGEIHVNGTLVTLFQSDPALFASPDIETRILDGTIKAEFYSDPAIYTSKMQTLVVNDGANKAVLRVAMLNRWSFSPFYKRERKRRLPSDQIVLGYAVHNRACEVTASAPSYNDDDDRLAVTSNLMGWAVFGVGGLATSFPNLSTRPVVVIFTDRAHRTTVSTAGFAYEAALPGTSAASAGAGSPCLTKPEHMHNTWVSGSGTSYRRLDDVVVCAIGTINGKPALEWRRDVRFLAVQELATCVSVLGIPLARTWYVTRGTVDVAGASYHQCTADEFIKDADGAVWTVD